MCVCVCGIDGISWPLTLCIWMLVIVATLELKYMQKNSIGPAVLSCLGEILFF